MQACSYMATASTTIFSGAICEFSCADDSHSSISSSLARLQPCPARPWGLKPNYLQVGIPSREFLLPVHAYGQLQLVSAAGHCWLASISALCTAYLQVLPRLKALLNSQSTHSPSSPELKCLIRAAIR